MRFPVFDDRRTRLPRGRPRARRALPPRYPRRRLRRLRLGRPRRAPRPRAGRIRRLFWVRRRDRGRPRHLLHLLRRRHPPATYGTLGGTTKDKAKYSYEIPSNWTEEAPSKVEKGAGGQDSRWVLVGSRGATKCSVLTLNRAGEDGAAFDLTDKALAAIAGADSRLQEAITTGEVTSKRSTENGQDYVTFSVSRARRRGSTP